MYIIIAILAFGILIAVHEFGHFITAKSLGIKVNEFSIGMGPAIFKRQRGETLYSLRCLPIGGFCAMEGEDEDTGDERAFNIQPAWKKILVLVAGSFMNFLLGLIVVIILYSGATAFVSSQVAYTEDTFPYGGENGLMAGDKVYSIDGARVYYADDFSMYMDRAGSAVDMTVIRDGKKVELKDYPLQRTNYGNEQGGEDYRYGISFMTVSGTLGEKLKYSFHTSYNFVRMVWMGLSDLISGRAGVKDMAGVVGIVSTINEVGEKSETASIALSNIAYICAFIAVNLAVMNLLPIPALDGGRIFFVIINSTVALLTRKKVNPKYEGYVHAAGLVLLLGLMVYIMFNDIVRIIS